MIQYARVEPIYATKKMSRGNESFFATSLGALPLARPLQLARYAPALSILFPIDRAWSSPRRPTATRGKPVRYFNSGTQA